MKTILESNYFSRNIIVKKKISRKLTAQFFRQTCNFKMTPLQRTDLSLFKYFQFLTKHKLQIRRYTFHQLNVGLLSNGPVQPVSILTSQQFSYNYPISNGLMCHCRRLSSFQRCGDVLASSKPPKCHLSSSRSIATKPAAAADPVGKNKERKNNKTLKLANPSPGNSAKSVLKTVLSLDADEVLNKGKGSNSSQLSDNDDLISNWIPVYRFGYIRLGRVIQRLKLFQTAFTCCVVLPGSFGCFLYGAIPFDYCIFAGFTSTLAAAMLYIMGTFCSRLIGAIYVSKDDPSLVRVAHMNFWGKRVDKILAKNEFIPFSELRDNVSDVYVNVKFYSELESKLHLCVRYGTVYDKEQFEDIFGSHGSIIINKVNAPTGKRKM